MPLPFNKSLDLKLLRLVKENPILYNTKHDKYLDFDSREVVWHKIGDTLNRPATVCKSRWVNIRDMMRRKIRDRIRNPTQRSYNYKYEDELSFIVPFFKESNAAAEFAAIQCQIHYGDFQEDKHKPGLIENLNEYLPEQYSSSWGIEKKILKLYRKHHGLSQVDAKCLYTKTARDLPTYGVTFFLVKEKQKGKKKLVPRLLGINSESVLRLDELTKEILQVWPLTQVMTYHVGKSDSFTLNFGDYSEKEYSVKTNDAHRIRDILEGYIDLIRKRLGAPYGSAHPESAAVFQDHVEVSRGNVITHVTNNPSKVIEHTFIGPSRIMPFEKGSEAQQGTQIMTVQQVVITSRGTSEQHSMTGEVPMRKDMSLQFVKKLNRMNSNSVQIVTLLTDPTEDNVKQAHNIINTMQGDMPDIIKGVKESASKQTNEDARRKLLNELDELCDYMNKLATDAARQDHNADDVQQSARRIADLTTQMYFSLDPRTRRRSELVRRSRLSFIADDVADATHGREVFVAAAASAAHAVDTATRVLTQEHQGPVPTDHQLQELETSAVDKMGKLNAAVALYLTAHSDPKNMNYSAAVTSMNTINELLPEFAKDASALSSASDNKSKQELLDQIRALCEALRQLCALTGTEDREKMKEAGTRYADVSGNLIYMVGRRNRRLDVDKENEIIDLSKDVGDMTTVLLVKVNELTALSEADPAAVDVDNAGVVCADAARDLLAAAQLTAPSIQEPHCQSALTAAAENLSSSAQRLAATWRPLVEVPDHHLIGEELKVCTMDLARALDRLRNAYANLGVANLDGIPDEEEDPAIQAQRLRFITSASAAKDSAAEAERELDMPTSKVELNDDQLKQLEADIAKKMAEINATVALLLQAKLDPQNPDYESAEQAITRISKILPEVITDTKTMTSRCGDDVARQAILDDMRTWCRGIHGVCATVGHGGSGDQELEEAAQTFARASQKLSFVFSPRANRAREQLLMELSSAAEQRALLMAEDTRKMSVDAGAGGARLAERAGCLRARATALHTAVQLTAPAIHEAPSQTALLTSVDHLSSSAQQLVTETRELQDHETGCSVLEEKLHKQREEIQRHGEVLEKHLDGIRETCREAAGTKTKPPIPTRTTTLQVGEHEKLASEPGSKVTTTAVAKAAPIPTASIATAGIITQDSTRHEDSHSTKTKPPVPTRTTTLQVGENEKLASETGSKVNTAVAKAVPITPVATAGNITQDFLHQLRCEESHNKENCPPIAFAEEKISEIKKEKASAAKKAKEDKRMQKQFVKTAENGEKNIDRAAEELKKVYGAQTTALSLEDAQSTAIHQHMEQMLAQAAVAAAALVACNHPESIDYAVAAKSTETLAELMEKITKDAALLSNSGNEKSRRLLLAEILALCDATKQLCAAAKDDKEKVNEAAVAFGDKSARLLYLVSTDVDPAQEKEVILRARAIGDSASRLAMGGANVAMGATSAHAQGICEAGRRAADTAGTLVYTAKLVAPAVHHPKCQNALVTASDDLSFHLKTFKATWEPLVSDPQHSISIAELATEANKLEQLLEGFRDDLVSGKLIKRREVEKVVVEDTALRQLALKILEDAKKRAERSATSEEKRRNFAEYSNKLTDAIKRLDLANSRCHLSPHNVNKRRELENAVQNLQVILLQARPTSGDRPQNNIVDLTDYVKDVSLEAERLTETANKTKVAHSNGKILESIKEECHKMNLHAFRLMHPPARRGYTDDPIDEILEVDQFGQDCDKGIHIINLTIQDLEDKKASDVLQEKTTALSESCNLLRFATNSALATARSAALDEALDDLTTLEKRIDSMLLPIPGVKSYITKEHNVPTPSLTAARARLVIATVRVSRGNAQDLAPSLAAYVTEMRASTDVSDPEQRNRLRAHVQKVLGALRLLAVGVSARLAVWQPVRCGELETCTQHILKEIENPANGVNTTKDEAQIEVLSEEDILKLLLPSDDTKISGDEKQLEDKLQQTATKLSSLTGTVVLSSTKPASLARSVHTAAEVAAQLATIARAININSNDPVHKKRIEEASQEMCFATYNLLKTSELVSQEPNNTGYRRRLLDACRQLNDSINKLARTTSSSSKLQKECSEMVRDLQTQLNMLQSGQPTCALPYAHCVDALCNQQEIIQKLNSEAPMSREELAQSLSYVAAAVCNSTEYAAHCAYLISISEHNKEAAREGLVDVARMQRLASSVHESCLSIIRTDDLEQVKHKEKAVNKQIEELKQVIQEATTKSNGDAKLKLTESGDRVDAAAKALHSAVNDINTELDEIHTCAMVLIDTVSALNAVAERAMFVPQPGDVSEDMKASRDHVITSSKALLSTTQALVKEVNSQDDDEPMTWVMFGGGRSAAAVVDAFQALLIALRQNGKRAGLIDLPKTESEEDADVPKKSYMQIQLDLAHKWLQRRQSKPEIQALGEGAVRKVIDIAEKMTEDLKGQEKEDMRHLITETEPLLSECSSKYDNEKANMLMERVRELVKAVERGVVTRVVEDFLEADAPLADLELLADAERDEAKRKFLLEKKIAELLAQLGRVKRTARVVADAGGNTGPVSQELKKCTDQTELLAPLLVKAAQDRVSYPDNATMVDIYRALLAQYAESLSKVRDRCDRAVDPMHFVQTAGETMQRMREESSQHNDPQRCAYTSTAIRRLAHRVMHVGMSSSGARDDPELRAALAAAQRRLAAAAPGPDARVSRQPDWRDTTAEILRTTGEVESVLGGENIFKKQPEPDQPIYNAALGLHAAVREWSARDNEIVAVAKRMAVLMARLAEYMNTDKKRELIVTSKSIVSESHEVARLAKKLALECTDIRIRTNLLQVCERIPTISGQLKMLTTVKGSSLGRQGTEEDKEAMNMLVGNAQNLMLSVQEVVKASASASVKIASQRGVRMRWVRRHYY